MGTPKQYIVKLHSYVELDQHIGQLATDDSTITHKWASDFVNAYAATLHSTVADSLRRHHEVDYIEEDFPIYTFAALKSQTNAPWFLQRINQDVKLSTSTTATEGSYRWGYSYDSSAGAGVDIYILGIHIEHEDFGGRARWGSKFGPGENRIDKNGHGTHVAGVAAGNRWGVAKAANLIAVKVAGDDGKGDGKCSNLIAGLEWVFLEAKASGRPSVINISCGGVGTSKAVNDAILSATNAGIHVVVAAGNEDTEASGTCPANAPSALTVGASNIRDERWISESGKGSNYGPCVDIFAPGVNIMSCETGGTGSRSGTSMASAIVAGIIARVIFTNGNLPPSVMTDNLKRLGVKGVLDLKCNGTENLLARYCVRTMAVFSFKSTFVKFKVENAITYMQISFKSIPSFRTADNVPASIYKGMSWDPKSPNSVQWSEGHKDENHRIIPVDVSVPLLIVNDGVPVTLELSHNANKSEGYYAHAKVASIDMYSQDDTGRSSKLFEGYPVKTKTTLARFSFKSESAYVNVPEPPSRILKSTDPCAYLRKAGDPTSHTSTTLTWKKSKGTTNLPYIIITPESVTTTRKVVTDITVACVGDSSATAETTFADCTYTSTNKKTWENCPVETQTVFASFRYKSNWAKFEVTTPGASVRKDPGVPAKTYDDVEFKGPSIQWKTDVNKTYGTGSIPILIVGPSPEIDIALDCGSDGEKSGDSAGTCSVNFGNRVYSYVGTSKDKTFTGCPMQTVIANALISFESNSAKVELKGGWLQKDPNADASIYDSNLEIKATSLTWASTGYVAKTLPFQILTPNTELAVDISISRGSDAKKEKDGKGFAIVTFGNHKYINNNETAPGFNKLLFTGCKLDDA